MAIITTTTLRATHTIRALCLCNQFLLEVETLDFALRDAPSPLLVRVDPPPFDIITSFEGMVGILKGLEYPLH